MNHTTSETHLSVPERGLVFDVGSLMAYLQQLDDPRDPRGVRYSLVNLLTLLILAKLGGEDTMKGMAEWIKLRGADLVRLLHLPRTSLPHQTTYERVLDVLDVRVFEQMIGTFFAQHTTEKNCVSFDGKTLRGTIPPGETQGTHLLAAYTPQQGVVLLQMEVADKTSEITALPRLLERLDLDGCVVTGDALLTQREIFEKIVKANADYVLPVKANQTNLRHAVASVFLPPPPHPGHTPTLLPHRQAKTVTARHGRIEVRYLTVSSHLNAYLDWPHLGQVFRLQRIVHHQKTGQLTYQVQFGITSLTAEACSPKRLLALIRDHWHIENRLHYVRDVTFHEDACRIRHPHRQHLLACLNNLVIGLIRRCAFPYVPDARRFFAVHYAQALQLLL